MNNSQSAKTLVPYAVAFLLAIGLLATMWGIYGAMTHSSVVNQQNLVRPSGVTNPSPQTAPQTETKDSEHRGNQDDDKE
jgi:hypothetical protein